MTNIPADGSTIIFTRKPNGSYASEGVAYLVKHYGKRTVDLQSVENGSHTQEQAYAFARSVWHVAA